MKPRLLLPLFAFRCLTAFALFAQQDSSPTAFRVQYGGQMVVLTEDEFKEVLSEAQSGDREAQYWLALIFHQGKSVARNDDQFFGWLTKSAEQGYAPAQQLLQPNIHQTDSMTLDRDKVKSEMFLLRGAEQGNADSQFWLGVAYEQNWFGTADDVEAVKWFRLAAEQGHPDAQTSLGQAYEYADGVEQNYALAAKWYRKAAEHVPNLGGAGVGRDGLARLYEQGLGVRKDYVQAYMWFRLADNESAIAELRSKMTETQILQAERITQEWKSHHPEPKEFLNGKNPEIVVQP